MSELTSSDPAKIERAAIIAAALIDQFGDEALDVAVRQHAAAFDGNAEAWDNVVRRLREL